MTWWWVVGLIVVAVAGAVIWLRKTLDLLDRDDRDRR